MGAYYFDDPDDSPYDSLERILSGEWSPDKSMATRFHIGYEEWVKTLNMQINTSSLIPQKTKMWKPYKARRS